MGSQFSADSFAGQVANQTNLAVKVSFTIDRLNSLAYSSDPIPSQAIVALKAASEIFLILGDNNRSQHYDVCPIILLHHFDMTDMSVSPECLYLVPGTMAECCTLVGQISLYPLL